MMSTELLLLMLLGMGNGLLHAFDADHMVAVSSLAGRGRITRRQIFRTALMWSLGHGTILWLIVLLVLGLGVTVPPSVFRIAELAIGIILLLVGFSILTPVFRRKIRLTSHHHGEDTAHTHFHELNHHGVSDHKPVLVGMVHGIAGSAPLLAVLPALFQENYSLASIYILLFSLCVGLAMCVFGGLLGRLSQLLCTKLDAGYVYLQQLLGIQALAFGSYWIYLSL